MRFTPFVAAWLLAALTGCSQGADRHTAAPKEQERDGARTLSWRRSFALPESSSTRRFDVTAPDPTTHRFKVRVEQRPADAHIFVGIKTAYGNLPVFDSNVQPYLVGNAVECEGRGTARACLMRFPTFVAERAGTWTVSIQKFSQPRAEVRVEVAFTPVRRGSRPRRVERGPLGATERFERDGIAFDYPSGWFLTTEPLSHAGNPVYRFAVSSVPVRRTAADEGPCLPGVARQLPPDAVLVYLREALGADRTRSLPRMARRPASFPLPQQPGGGLCGFEHGSGRWYPFKDGRRAFYLGVYVGPAAPAASRRALKSLLDGMEIRAR